MSATAKPPAEPVRCNLCQTLYQPGPWVQVVPINSAAVVIVCCNCARTINAVFARQVRSGPTEVT